MKYIIKYIENILPKIHLKLYYECIRNISKIHSKYIKKHMKNILQIYYQSGIYSEYINSVIKRKMKWQARPRKRCPTILEI